MQYKIPSLSRILFLLWITLFLSIMLHTFYYAGVKLGMWAVPHAIGYTIAGYWFWKIILSRLERYNKAANQEFFAPSSAATRQELEDLVLRHTGEKVSLSESECKALAERLFLARSDCMNSELVSTAVGEVVYRFTHEVPNE